MKDLHSKVGLVQALAPAVVSATATSAAIDMQGFNSAIVVVNTGAIVGSGDYTTKLTECDTSDGTYTDIAAADLTGSFPETLEAASVVKVGYIGNKRYLKTVTTKNSGTSIAAGIVVVQGHPSDAPVA